MSRIDVFRNFPNQRPRSSSSLNDKGMRKYKPHKGDQYSDSDIREKIKARTAKKSAPIKKKVKGQRLGESFMNPDKIKAPDQNLLMQKKAEREAAQNAPRSSDIQANDPNDTNTTEKLKGLLSAGGFEFSEKERATLAKILN